MSADSVVFHAETGPASLAFVRPQSRRGGFGCRVEVTTEAGETLGVDLAMISAYSSEMAQFFAELPAAIGAGRTTDTRSEFAELSLTVRAADPTVFEVRLWWRDLGDERTVDFDVSSAELRRACAQMPLFFGEVRASPAA
jgi:hypothetical protein